jgi:hypothetical protein
MTTDISVSTTASQVEDRQWLASPHGTDPGTNPSVTLSVAAFDEADHYADGYVPSGTVVGKITASGLYGPYDDAASDGTEVAAGILYGSLQVKDKVKVGGAIVVHGFVTESKLPLTGVTGALDAAAKTDLKHIKFL